MCLLDNGLLSGMYLDSCTVVVNNCWLGFDIVDTGWLTFVFRPLQRSQLIEVRLKRMSFR